MQSNIPPETRSSGAHCVMSILVLPTSAFVERQLAALRTLAPREMVFTDPASAPPADIEAILAFRMAAGIAPRFPALRFVGCAGAGVDELLGTPDLPARVAITRAVDSLQGTRMAQYVALTALRHFRELPRLSRSGHGPERHWTVPRRLQASTLYRIFSRGAVSSSARCR